jgi:hypothetical protein
MPILNLLPASARLISFGILFAILSQPGHNPAQDLRREVLFPAYIQRGDEVEKLYIEYSKRLAGYGERLGAALRKSAPDLLVLLGPLDRIASGYQILPQITSDPSPEEHPRASSIAYSWPWTKRLIDREVQAIAVTQAELGGITSKNAMEQRALFERLARNYREQSLRHGNIDAHVRYNRLWQAAIAADRSGYDRETALHALILERQKIDDSLRRVRGTFEKLSPEKFSISFSRTGEAVRLSEIARDLRSRNALLARRIDEAMGTVQSPKFIRMENFAAEWIFRVPLFTDIEDRKFVAEVKRIVESTWRIVDATNTYRVEVDVSYLPVDLLYLDGGVPARGDTVDMARHLARFPAGGAILTTGGLTTHVRDRAIVLGPNPLSPRVLAHEFGHILGFRDRYVRGYRNLGRNGFQVIEAVADPRDIMGAATHGSVSSYHFSRLVEHYTKQLPRALSAPKPTKGNSLRARSVTAS